MSVVCPGCIFGYRNYRTWGENATRRRLSRARIMLWFSGESKQSVVLYSQAFIDATEYIPAQVSGDICGKDRCPPCATNILVNTRQGRRVAQAALELCRSPERRDLRTFISIISLNAELVACRRSTPWKSRQNLSGPRSAPQLLSKFEVRQIAAQHRQTAGAIAPNLSGPFLMSAFGGKADITVSERHVCF
jgi:hypothetical protein